MRVVPCSTDEGHWDVVLQEQPGIVVYHSSSYFDCQTFAFGLQQNSDAVVLHNQRLAVIIDHKTPSGV